MERPKTDISQRKAFQLQNSIQKYPISSAFTISFTIRKIKIKATMS